MINQEEKLKFERKLIEKAIFDLFFDVCPELTYENPLQALQNISENVTLNKINKIKESKSISQIEVDKAEENAIINLNKTIEKMGMLNYEETKEVVQESSRTGLMVAKYGYVFKDENEKII